MRSICWSASTRRRSTSTTTSWPPTATWSATPSRCGSPRSTSRAPPRCALAAIAQEAGGNRRGKNMVSVGLVCGLLGIDTARIEEMILKRYAHKGDVGESNIRSLRAGFEHARDDLPGGAHKLGAGAAPDEDRLLVSGNQAICLGALHAGLRLLRRLPDHARPATSSSGWRPGCRASAASRSRPRTRSPRSRRCWAPRTRAARR